VSREAQAFVLVLLGGALVRAGATDLYLRYVKAGLQPLLLGAGVVLIVAGVVTVWHEWRPRQARPYSGHDGRHSGHANREPRVSWLLLLPLLGLSLVAPPALGSYSASNTGTALRRLDIPVEVPPTGPLRLRLLDYAGRAVYDHGRSLVGRPIILTGFITVDRDGAPYLTRMLLSCCAADAGPIKVRLSGRVPPVLQPDTWFAVTGTYTARQTTDPINGGPIPYIDISRADPVSAPPDPYENW
jgi:putative membrane protein